MMNDPLLDLLADEIRVLRTRLDELYLGERLAFTPWTTWTPAIDQAGAVAHTATRARYMVIEKLAIVQALLAVTAAGSAGTQISVSGWPAAIDPTLAALVVGSARITRAGGNDYMAAVQALGTTAVRFVGYDTTTAGIGGSPSLALASGDTIAFSAMWDIA